jgi:hypothetical protein
MWCNSVVTPYRWVNLSLGCSFLGSGETYQLVKLVGVGMTVEVRLQPILIFYL